MPKQSHHYNLINIYVLLRNAFVSTIIILPKKPRYVTSTFCHQSGCKTYQCISRGWLILKLRFKNGFWEIVLLSLVLDYFKWLTTKTFLNLWQILIQMGVSLFQFPGRTPGSTPNSPPTYRLMLLRLSLWLSSKMKKWHGYVKLCSN